MSRLIRPGTREKVFSLYSGQEVFQRRFTESEEPTLYNINPIDVSLWCLFLTPLSNISDEDAIVIGKHRYPDPWKYTWEEVGRQVSNDFINGLTNKSDYVLDLYEIDYLRSRGYALDYLDYTVDNLVEAGIFKLKGKL